MAGYLGSVPVPQATQHRETFTATAAQTSFATAGYTPQFVDVYLNGVHLSPADVTATNGSDVVLTACLVNDIVDVVSYTPFEVANQTFTGTTAVDVATVGGTLGVTGIATFTDDIIIGDGKTIGSASDPDAIAISSGGVVSVSATTASTSSTTGALTVGGGMGIAADLTIGDDLSLKSDGAVLNIGADNDLKISHSGSAGTINNNTGDLSIQSDGNLKLERKDGGEDYIHCIADGAVELHHNGTKTLETIASGIQISTPQIATQFDLSSALRIHPASTTDSGGYTNAFFGTSTSNNFGVAVGAKRAEANGNPSFQIRILNDSVTGLEVFNITTAGAVTKPKQPAFLVRPSSAQNNLAENTVIAFGTEIFDQGADFSSNTFTAPVTGRYQIQAGVRIAPLDTAATWNRIELIMSNRSYNSAIMDPGVLSSDPVYWHFNISVLADMDADDTAQLRWGQSGGTTQVDVDVDSHFSGYLVC